VAPFDESIKSSIGYVYVHTVASYCTKLQGTADSCKVLQTVAKYCRQLQSTADSCKVLQTVARYCRQLQGTADSCKVLQTVAKYCRQLQGTADSCKVLQTAPKSNTKWSALNILPVKKKKSQSFYSPPDAQEKYIKRNIKIYIKIAATCFGLT
jgi:trans-aconitate methyltransferase